MPSRAALRRLYKEQDVVHSDRVGRWALRMALSIGWSTTDAERLREAAEAHDIGKVTIDPAILSQPRRLTPSEWAEVTKHPVAGEALLREAGGLDDEQLLWVRHHHEHADGSGYPDALSREQIPLGAALIAVADAVDAMTADRVYQKARPLCDALSEVRCCCGTQFLHRAVTALDRVCVQLGLPD